MPRIKHKKDKLLLTAAAAFVVLLVWIFQLPCVYRFFFGVPCPGCGMTRAMIAALRLDFVTAFHHHWMFWSVPVAYLYFLLDGRVLGEKWLDRGVLVLIGVGFFINWLFNPAV